MYPHSPITKNIEISRNIMPINSAKFILDLGQKSQLCVKTVYIYIYIIYIYIYMHP